MALLAEVEPKCLGKLVVKGGWGVVSCGNYVVFCFRFFFFFFFFTSLPRLRIPSASSTLSRIVNLSEWLIPSGQEMGLCV